MPELKSLDMSSGSLIKAPSMTWSRRRRKRKYQTNETSVLVKWVYFNGSLEIAVRGTYRVCEWQRNREMGVKFCGKKSQE